MVIRQHHFPSGLRTGMVGSDVPRHPFRTLVNRLVFYMYMASLEMRILYRNEVQCGIKPFYCSCRKFIMHGTSTEL